MILRLSRGGAKFKPHRLAARALKVGTRGDVRKGVRTDKYGNTPIPTATMCLPIVFRRSISADADIA